MQNIERSTFSSFSLSKLNWPSWSNSVQYQLYSHDTSVYIPIPDLIPEFRMPIHSYPFDISTGMSNRYLKPKAPDKILNTTLSFLPSPHPSSCSLIPLSKHIKKSAHLPSLYIYQASSHGISSIPALLCSIFNTAFNCNHEIFSILPSNSPMASDLTLSKSQSPPVTWKVYAVISDIISQHPLHVHFTQ